MLTFNELKEANASRATRWHKNGITEWSPSDWSCAVAGEMGEVCEALALVVVTAGKVGRLCDVVKKFNRVAGGIASKNNPKDLQDAIQKVATEIGDTVVYLDLLAQRMGIDLAQSVRDTFNRVSIRENMPERL